MIFRCSFHREYLYQFPPIQVKEVFYGLCPECEERWTNEMDERIP